MFIPRTLVLCALFAFMPSCFANTSAQQILEWIELNPNELSIAENALYYKGLWALLDCNGGVIGGSGGIRINTLSI